MVGVAEELLRLATFTTEFDIKAVIADRVAYCFEVVCEHVQKELRGTENEFTLGSRKLRHDPTQIRHSNVFQQTGVGSEIR